MGANKFGKSTSSGSGPLRAPPMPTAHGMAWLRFRNWQATEGVSEHHQRALCINAPAVLPATQEAQEAAGLCPLVKFTSKGQVLDWVLRTHRWPSSVPVLSDGRHGHTNNNYNHEHLLGIYTGHYAKYFSYMVPYTLILTTILQGNIIISILQVELKLSAKEPVTRLVSESWLHPCLALGNLYNLSTSPSTSVECEHEWLPHEVRTQ